MLRCSKLPSLELMRGELVTILGSSASRTRSLLGNHQQMLAANLDQYVKQSQEGGSSSSSSSSKASEEDSWWMIWWVDFHVCVCVCVCVYVCVCPVLMICFVLKMNEIYKVNLKFKFQLCVCVCVSVCLYKQIQCLWYTVHISFYLFASNTKIAG